MDDMLEATQAHGQSSGRAIRAQKGGSQRVGAFTLLPALIRGLGADPDAMLASSGLPVDALDDGEKHIPYALIGSLLREAARVTRCEHVGLLAGRLWHLADLGVVGEVVRNSATVGDALRGFTACQHHNSESAVLFLREAGGAVDLGCAIYETGIEGVDQMVDAYLAAAVNFLRELCGPAWTPSEVFLSHSLRGDPAQYRRLFKVSPHFNSEFCALRFPARWLETPIAGADLERLRRARKRIGAARRPPLVQQVVRALRILLLDGRSSGDDVAAMLSMHRRTLNRRLKALGTTYQETLDRVRFDVAQQLLGASDISLDEVAAALGYAGVSPFMRSFKRWTGATPTQWRRAAHRRNAGQ